MTDWAVGDLAVVVGRSKHPRAWAPKGCAHPPKGVVHTVVAVVPGPDWIALGIAGFPAPHWSGGWQSECFRKIRPDEHKGEREDWRLIIEQHTRKAPTPQERHEKILETLFPARDGREDSNSRPVNDGE